MPIYRLLLFLLLLFVATGLYADAHFSFTPAAKEAYHSAVNLRFADAQAQIDQIKLVDPDNLIIYHIENYIDFFTIIINEDVAEFRRLEKNKSLRLDKIKQGDQSSPYYLYAQAEVRLQWALARLKFEEYFTAFTEVSKAYKLLTENEQRFPSFVANKKSLGVLHAVIGTVPDTYRWGIKLLGGMDGSIAQGTKEIEAVLQYAKTNEFIFEEETLVLYAFLMLHLKNNTNRPWQILRNSRLDPNKNPLACFVLANVAMRTGRNDEAIRILQHRPVSRDYHPFHYLDYMLGLAKLKRLDTDADVYLKRYVKNFKGRSYLKEAYQKLAWDRLIKGDESGYQRYIQYCLEKGATQIEGDKSAYREAKSGEIPHADLLRARLLSDGGYYRRGYELLIAKTAGDFSVKRQQLEFSYRLGRILHEMKNLPDALQYYQTTILEGKDEPYYFACNAALQAGNILEGQKRYQQARIFYNLCLEMRPDQYRNGLHQKAKAGLNRLKEVGGG